LTVPSQSALAKMIQSRKSKSLVIGLEGIKSIHTKTRGSQLHAFLIMDNEFDRL
jgi:hypothetical protein